MAAIRLFESAASRKIDTSQKSCFSNKTSVLAHVSHAVDIGHYRTEEFLWLVQLTN